MADLSLGSFRYTLERTNVLTAALPYYQTYQIYGILSTSQLFTSLELLLYPFDVTTWYLLIVSMISGFLFTILVTDGYNYSKFIRFAMGYPPLRNASMNMFRFLFGQNIMQTPETNFARFTIVSYHVYSLLLRTVYQSLLFQSVKLNIYHEPPHTLTELIDQQCSLVMTEGTYDSVYTVPRIKQGIVDVLKIKNTSEESVFDFVENDNEERCLAVVTPKDFITYHTIKEQKRGLFYVLPESIFAQHVTMYFSKHSFLINRFNELFMNLRSMGLIDFWAHQSLDTSFLENIRESGFKPINVENLDGILFICSVLILICLVVFLLELLVFEMKMFIFFRRHKFVD